MLQSERIRALMNIRAVKTKGTLEFTMAAARVAGAVPRQKVTLEFTRDRVLGLLHAIPSKATL